MKSLLIAAAFALAAPAAASAADITGAWALSGSVPAMNFDFTLTCDFKQEAMALTGSCKDQQGTVMATTGTVADKSVTFAYDANFGGPIHVIYKGDLQADGTLKGAFDGGQAQGVWTAKKP